MQLEEIKTLKALLDRSLKVVFFTGAGILTPSGIPDFRSSGGLYTQNLEAENCLSIDYFKQNPKDFYNFYRRYMVYEKAKPNIAHEFIASFKKCDAIITQNIDGLHEASGSNKVITLHGSIWRNHCTKCHSFYDLDFVMHDYICPKCKGIIKPDVVLYGEALDPNDIYEAIAHIKRADLLVVIGSSLRVYPAAGFLDYLNGRLVIINKDATYYDDRADLVIHDDIIKVIKALKKVS